MNFYLAVYALGRVAPRHVITFGITKLPYSQDVLPDEKPRMICGLGLPGTQQFNSSCSVAYFAQWMCLFFSCYVVILSSAPVLLLPNGGGEN
jgi:hypothetical protein